MAEETVTVEGETTEKTTSQYGTDGCDTTMHVVIDGEDVYVPYTGVRTAAYDFRGDMPDTFDVDTIFVYDGRIHAEVSIDGGVVELKPNYNSATGAFRGYDAWEFERFGDDTVREGEVVFEREGEGAGE